MPAFHFEVDAHTVLGIAPDASLGAIRDAYRQQSKRYHPDAGGDAWAFRVLVKAYELLSTARVVRAAQVDSPPPSATPATERAKDPRFGPSSAETAWPGPSDEVRDPSRVVDVEKLWVRYEVDHIWLLEPDPNGPRFISCSLNVTWPARDSAVSDDAAEVIARLHEVFDEIGVATRVISSQCQAVEDRFSGWLSYPNPARATAAIAKLRELLHARGLAIRTWNRDMLIPRDWR